MTDTCISALVLYADSAAIPYPSQLNPDVERYHAIVGGYIESVRLTMPDGTQAAMYVNEEGKLDGLPVNPVATLLVRTLNLHIGKQDIVGTVVIVGVDGCEDADVPGAVVSVVQQLHVELRIAGYVRTLRERGER
ncbi:DUF3846 domain-containing protein [Mycolicibacter arupensis]|uniref:DUF3846 domain-containing protein n=1 Tax=Mycolicibacter arupensis TaxID=342002 RepID=A0A5C7Y230_9MYCO|nr:DUF3846 domain-containing protein [Mycolicibacter arupensis]TXI55945.1 MAG: DUF3846 domain-containing protein [Mycolicibacter arupensis]